MALAKSVETATALGLAGLVGLPIVYAGAVGARELCWDIVDRERSRVAEVLLGCRGRLGALGRGKRGWALSKGGAGGSEVVGSHRGAELAGGNGGCENERRR